MRILSNDTFQKSLNSFGIYCHSFLPSIHSCAFIVWFLFLVWKYSPFLLLWSKIFCILGMAYPNHGFASTLLWFLPSLPQWTFLIFPMVILPLLYIEITFSKCLAMCIVVLPVTMPINYTVAIRNRIWSTNMISRVSVTNLLFLIILFSTSKYSGLTPLQFPSYCCPH